MANQLFTNENDVFVFGKYNGEKFSSVFSSNPGYINWAIDNKIIEMTEELNNRMNNSSASPLVYIRDNNIGNFKSFIHDMISQKLVIELIAKRLEIGIELTKDNEEKNSADSIGINPVFSKLFETAKVSFRENRLKNKLNEIKSELSTKINLLFDYASGQKTILSDDKLIYFYEEEDEVVGISTIEIRFNKSQLGYNSLEIFYNAALLVDSYYFDISSPIK